MHYWVTKRYSNIKTAETLQHKDHARQERRKEERVNVTIERGLSLGVRDERWNAAACMTMTMSVDGPHPQEDSIAALDHRRARKHGWWRACACLVVHTTASRHASAIASVVYTCNRKNATYRLKLRQNWSKNVVMVNVRRASCATSEWHEVVIHY